MQRIPYCYRRGAVYYWRRWSPAPNRVLFSLSLGVKEQKAARVICLKLATVSVDVFAKFSAGQMDEKEARLYLMQVVQKAQSDHVPGAIASWVQQNDRHLVSGWANYLLGKRGVTASLNEHDRRAILEHGNEQTARLVAAEIERLRRSEASLSKLVDIRAELETTLGRDPSAADVEQAFFMRFFAKAQRHFRAAESLSSIPAPYDKLIAECERAAVSLRAQSAGSSMDLLHTVYGFLKQKQDPVTSSDPNDIANDVFHQLFLSDFFSDWIDHSGPGDAENLREFNWLESTPRHSPPFRRLR